jgi:hypothetical protein
MTLLVPWFVFPLALAALCLGCGLFVQAVTRTRLAPELLLPVGLATVVAVGAVTVSLAATAKLTTPLVAAIAAAGFVLARSKRRDGWSLAAAAATYACYGAPVLASGTATFAGYIKLDDTATFLALTDRFIDHGRSLAGLAPSSYEATLSVNLAHGYPLGSLIPLGIGHELVRTDVAWLYQPWLSFCAAALALCLYNLVRRVVPRPPLRALVAFVAAQSALLLGYALWGGVKELAATALIATAAATATTEPSRARVLLPFAIASASVVDTLSIAGAVWLAPMAVPLVVLLRRAPGLVAVGAASAAVLALPALATAAQFLGGTNLSTFENGVVLGNLTRALQPLQIVGIWPSGDFRREPSASVVTALLIALAVAAALIGVIRAFDSRAWSLLLGLASAVAGALVFAGFGSPWLGAKALAIGSPFVLLTALCGCFASMRRSFARGRIGTRFATLAAMAIGVALVAGVGWSDALAYHDVDLAPRAQLQELEEIGNHFAGDGPTLMTEYQPYGVRHFLRRLDPEGASELRRRPVRLRSGGVAGKGEYVDLDQIDLAAVLVYRTLVLRRSPTESRPPASYGLVWRGRSYDVWQRRSNVAPVQHLPLGGPLQAAGVPRCAAVRSLAAYGRVVAVPRPLNLVWSIGPARLPAGWSALPGGAVLPARTGTLALPIRLTGAGLFRVWIGGSTRGSLTVAIDGTQVGSASWQLQNAGQWLDVGSARLAAGRHTVRLHVSLGALSPGTGGGGFPLGPFLLEREAPETLVAPLPPTSLCGHTFDWLEALPQ